jgi:hypothetical protein
MSLNLDLSEFLDELVTTYDAFMLSRFVVDKIFKINLCFFTFHLDLQLNKEMEYFNILLVYFLLMKNLKKIQNQNLKSHVMIMNPENI